VGKVRGGKSLSSPAFRWLPGRIQKIENEYERGYEE
jgi:hypothetical protein